MSTTTSAEAASVFFAFARVIRNAIQATSPESCSFLHVKTLSFIKEHKEPTMRDVASELRVSSPAATAIIDRLVETEDLERITDSADRRIVRLKVSKRGLSILEHGLAAIHANIQEKMSVLSSVEQKQLMLILRKLIDVQP